MSLVCISTKSAGAIGPAYSTAMICRACRGPTTVSKAVSAIQVAACCGPRARKASRSARCNVKALGNSSRAPPQRPSYWRPWVKRYLRTWRRKGSALRSIANGSACKADPCDRPKSNLITYVRGGRRYSLQAQGDFRGIAKKGTYFFLTFNTRTSTLYGLDHGVGHPSVLRGRHTHRSTGSKRRARTAP